MLNLEPQFFKEHLKLTEEKNEKEKNMVTDLLQELQRKICKIIEDYCCVAPRWLPFWIIYAQIWYINYAQKNAQCKTMELP